MAAPHDPDVSVVEDDSAAALFEFGGGEELLGYHSEVDLMSVECLDPGHRQWLHVEPDAVRPVPIPSQEVPQQRHLRIVSGEQYEGTLGRRGIEIRNSEDRSLHGGQHTS